MADTNLDIGAHQAAGLNIGAWQSSSAPVVPPVMITNKTTSKSRQRLMVVQSDPADPTDTVELSNLPSLPYCFASVRFFDGAGAAVVPSAGSLVVLIQTQGQAFEAPASNTIDATAATTVTWFANTQSVRVTPTALAGITTWQLILTFNLA